MFVFIVVEELIIYSMVVNYHGDQIFVDFIRFLTHNNYEVLYT